MATWLDDDEMAAWLGLIGLHAELMAELEDDLVQGHGITAGDYGVLVNLAEAEGGGLRMCDLAARLHLSPSGLTRRLDGLVRQGLVAREPAHDDRRVILAVLTPDGRVRLEQAAPDHVAGVRRGLFDHLTPAQVRQLAGVLDTIKHGRARSRATALEAS